MSVRSSALRTAVAALAAISLGAVAFAPAVAAPPVAATATSAELASLPVIDEAKRTELGADWFETFLDTADGERLYATVMVPAGTDLNDPSVDLPVVAVVSPYLGYESISGHGPSDRFLDLIEGADLIANGYAVVQVSTRGTGGSSGCLDILGPGEQLDTITAVEWAAEGKKVVLVRPETKPDDVHGMLASEGIVTSRGGRTSHAALVARQFGKPAVVGIAELDIDLEARTMSVGDRVVAEGEYVSIEGTIGEVYLGQLPAVVPDIRDRWLSTLLSWADEFRRLKVLANADYPADAARAKEYGAQGIGLCRTEHMFFDPVRLPTVQRMILAKNTADRQEALDILLPMQREDFRGLFEEMSGMPVIIRMIDPPLHEFLPTSEELERQLDDLEHNTSNTRDAEIKELDRKIARVAGLHEENPMLGFRGVRLGILMPEISRMQARAIIEAACDAIENGFDPMPEIMIPVAIHVKEIERLKALIVAVADEVMAARGITVKYQVGTMVETPRAALTAGPLAREAEFFSFGTNDLTQTTFAISRDDAEKSFLIQYVEQGILPVNPFQTIDRRSVGELIKIAVEGGRKQRPGMEIGICGEHGGDPESIAMCHEFGLDYVSCSPYRVPVARLAAAHAAINDTSLSSR